MYAFQQRLNFTVEFQKKMHLYCKISLKNIADREKYSKIE